MVGTQMVLHVTVNAGWKGEESVKERVVLDEPQVVPFLEGTYTLEAALADLDNKVRSHPNRSS